MINGFEANILVENNILSLESFVININKNCTFIKSYKVTIFINEGSIGNFLEENFLLATTILYCLI